MFGCNGSYHGNLLVMCIDVYTAATHHTLHPNTSMQHRCRHHSAPAPTPQTRPPHMLSGQVSVVPRAPVAPGTQLPPALKTERFGPRCHGGENGDHLRTRPHKRKGGKVGRTGGAHSTSPRLPYIAASRHGRPASCRRLSQAAPMLLLRRRTTNSPTCPAHHYGLLPACAGSGVGVAVHTAPGLPR